MRTAEIRRRWLDYFGENDHELCPSVPLISPDPSILFTIAGMVPFIPYIVGTEKAPWPRAASVQKCIRTNDIEEVGRTTRHGTFFQMCGNFSFGDYFKEGASKYAWDLLTGSVNDGKYGLDGDKLWITVWENDDEAYDIWANQIGLDKSHIQLLPREDIFWDTGQPGPAGPCAEIHYDRGPAYGPDGGPKVDLKGDRFLEIWNLVFDQYLRGEGTGKDYPLLGELDAKAIDTGLGLERLAFLLQGKDNMYEIDEVYPVIAMAEEMTGRKYGRGGEFEGDDIRMRVVADHIRSAMMLICDGVRPGNDGRGYVLRRLIRRAVRSMRLLGIDEPVLPHLMPVSRTAMEESYPELATGWTRISDIAYAEEEAFRRTLGQGTTILDLAVNRAKESNPGKEATLSGDDAFALHDTYGFPIDLTLEMANEQGVNVDEKRFKELMNEQKQRARQDALAKKTGHVDSRVYQEISAKVGGSVEFLGYTENNAEALVVGILVDGKAVPCACAPAEVEIILNRTPFYAESGGQLADRGTIATASGALIDVHDVQAPIKGLSVHRGSLTEGEITLDDLAHARIDVDRRNAIAQAHTSTHVIHELLMEKLGRETNQAGSENAPSRMRFDFRHSAAVGQDVMDEIEAQANQILTDDLEVTDQIMDLSEAKALGAQALFGEKYGNRVRMVSIGGDWSRELCGGTHVPNTAKIGRITILGESSIGSGVRRVDALVGQGAYGFQAKEHALVSQLSTLVGRRPEELPEQVGQLMERLRKAEKELARIKEANLLSRAQEFFNGAHRVGDIMVSAFEVGEIENVNAVRTLAMAVRERFGAAESAVVAAFAVSKGRPTVIVGTNEAARNAGVKAGKLVKGAAMRLGGGGGGKDDFAQGGGQNIDAIAEALAGIDSDIRDILTK